MKNIVNLLCFVMLVTMSCRSRINDKNVVPSETERISLCKSMLLQEDNTVKAGEVGSLPTEIDSVKIALWHLSTMIFHVYPDTTGYAYPEAVGESTDTLNLSREICQLVLNAVDSMYLRRIPVVTSMQLDSVVTCIDYIPSFEIFLYDKDKIYTRKIDYSPKVDDRHFEFTAIFNQLANGTIALQDSYYAKKREREEQESKEQKYRWFR